MLQNQGFNSKVDKQKKPWYEHYKKPWHIKETCQKLHGKPPNWKRKFGGDGRAFQATIEESLSTKLIQKQFIHEGEIKALTQTFSSPKLSVNTF